MFQYRSSQRPEPSVVKTLLIANIAAFFVAQLILEPAMGIITIPGIGYAPKHLYSFGFVPSLALDQGYIWQFFSHMFLHGGLGHIFLNMFALYMFGNHLERHIGRQRFTFLYFACGIGAALLQALFAYNANVPMIGASGAVMGVAAGFAYFFPNSVLLVFGILPVKAWKVIAFYAVFELINVFGNPGSPIAHAAHFGGLAVSLLILQLLYRKYKLFSPGSAPKKSQQKDPPKRKESDSDGVIELERDRDGWWR